MIKDLKHDVLLAIIVIDILTGLTSLDPEIVLCSVTLSIPLLAMLVYRDEVLRKKTQPVDELREKLESLETEISMLKLKELSK